MAEFVDERAHMQRVQRAARDKIGVDLDEIIEKKRDKAIAPIAGDGEDPEAVDAVPRDRIVELVEQIVTSSEDYAEEYRDNIRDGDVVVAGRRGDLAALASSDGADEMQIAAEEVTDDQLEQEVVWRVASAVAREVVAPDADDWGHLYPVLVARNVVENLNNQDEEGNE